MAYHSTSGTASNTADFLVRLKDFLVGTVGWTLRDDRSGDAEPSYVLVSTGESGAEDIFLRFVNDAAADRIAVRAYLYWDAATHARVKEAFNTSYTYIKTVDASAFLYWIYADMDHVFIVTKIAAVYYGHYCGLLRRFWYGAVAVTQAAASPGAGVTLQVNDASIFRVGGYYLIKDNAGIERVQVTAVDTVASPNTISVASLVAAYALGAKIGEDPQPVVVGHYQSPGSFYALNKFDGWASATGQTGSCGAANVLTVAEGLVYIDGCLERVPGAVLTYDLAKTSGADYVYVELLKYNYGYNHDAVLINPATGEPTAERKKWVLSLKDHDTSGEALPNNVTQRKVVALHKFDRESGDVTATVREKSNLYLQDILGTLPGSRITVASITEDQLAFAAAEGLNSLLQNLAERTYDQAGSYLVKGLDSFIGDNDGENVEVITNAGRAYIQGFRLQKNLPTTTLVPKSTAIKSVRGEQKTYVVGTRRYALNSTPLKETTQVEAIVEIVSNITRGSVGGGEDLLVPNPVVDILEVSQGATVFQEGADWQQSGNYVDWLGSGNEPAIGTTYTVRWTYTKQMIKGTDYVDGGWFGRSTHPAAGVYFYLVTAQSATGETQYDPAKVVSRDTLTGEMNRLSWLPVSGATGYRIYRGTQNTVRADFQRLKDVASGVTSYIDDGVDEIVGGNPPASNTSGLTMSPVQVEPGNLSIINFGRTSIGDEPVAGSNSSIDYDYYVGRKDIIYATTREIKRLEGSPADWPKLPIVPEGTLGLCSVDCPPNSVDLTVVNFGLTRITMDQIHEIIKDVEDLKYNDAQFQMNNELQNRDAQTKKGVYSDDFSNDAQSGVYHSEWSARIDRGRRFAAPARTASATVLTINPPASNALFKGSLALLPASERVLIEQTDWSEVKNINPYAVFEKPDASVEITPNIGRRGQTGIAVIGANFLSNANNVTIRCDGQVVASGVHADTAGRVTASFVIPENARNGNRIVEVTDGAYSAQANLQINDPLIITASSGSWSSGPSSSGRSSSSRRRRESSAFRSSGSSGDGSSATAGAIPWPRPSASPKTASFPPWASGSLRKTRRCP